MTFERLSRFCREADVDFGRLGEVAKLSIGDGRVVTALIKKADFLQRKSVTLSIEVS
jgi:hypothetical protein